MPWVGDRKHIWAREAEELLMNRVIKMFVSVVATWLLAVGPAWGAPITVLTFAGLQEGEQVQNYYNGGLGSLGSGPGPADGITFTADAVVLNDQKHYVGEPSPPEVLLLGDNSVPGGAGVSFTMNVAGGFAPDLSFYYGSIDAPAVVEIWSGLNGTGTMLASQMLPITSPDMSTTAIFTSSPVDVPWSGIAQSAVFKGGNQQIVFDDIAVTIVPEPYSFILLGEGAAVVLAVLASLRLRRGPR
jgi:hypothetical protein